MNMFKRAVFRTGIKATVFSAVVGTGMIACALVDFFVMHNTGLALLSTSLGLINFLLTYRNATTLLDMFEAASHWDDEMIESVSNVISAAGNALNEKDIKIAELEIQLAAKV